MAPSTFEGFGVKVKMPFIDIQERKVIASIICELTLSKEYIEYLNLSRFTEYDDNLGIDIEKYSDYSWIRKKHDICSIEILFDNKNSLYVVELEFNTCDGRMGWFFPDESSAKNTYNVLKEYWKS